MAEEKKTLKFQMMMSPAEAEVLDDWMFKNRVRSRAEAIRRLCRMALTQEEMGPEIGNRMQRVVDTAILLGDETLREAPRTPEESAELRSLASDMFSRVYALYEKLVEQAVRLGGLRGDMDLAEAIEWEKRAADFLKGRSLFDSFRDSPQAMEMIEQAAKKQRDAKGRKAD